jgi:DNA-binding transcriptional LysR family regulator
MHVHNLEEVLKRMSNGEFDLGIVEGPFDKSKFNYKKFKDDELVLVASPLNSYPIKLKSNSIAEVKCHSSC